jgi:small subunit ribosomal protein S4e
MARGPKKHMKRLNAPKKWMLSKLGGIYAPRPSTGPHKLRESFPLSLILRNRLKYALSRRETVMIMMRRLVQVDSKVRTDLNYPVGFQDVVSLPRSGENFRLTYDVKGRFKLQAIDAEEAKFKLCRVVRAAKAKKGTIGRNPFMTKQAAAIPYIVTHDGRTIRYADPDIKVNDTVKIDIAANKVVEHVQFDVGNLAMLTGGNNMGRIGVILTREKHPGSFDIIHLRDKRGNTFATRLSNVFVVGQGTKALVTMPAGGGVRNTIEEDREKNLKRRNF